MYSVRSLLLCLLSIPATLFVCGEAGAVSLPPTQAGTQPSLPRAAMDESVSLWNLLNPWAGTLADNKPSLAFAADSASSEGVTASAVAEEKHSSAEDYSNSLKRYSLLTELNILLTPTSSTAAGSSTSGPSHAPGSSTAMTNPAEDLAPQIVVRLVRQRESAHPILKPSSVFHPPRR